MNIQKAKKHHFVPECYLKNFVLKGKLYSLDIHKVQKGYNTIPRLTQPSKICYLEDYYKIEPTYFDSNFRLNEHEDLFIETEVLKNLENKYGNLYEKIIQARDLTFDDAINISDFIVQLKLRNPYWLEKTISPHKNEWIDSVMNDIYDKTFMKEERFSHIPEEIQKLVYKHVREASKSDTSFAKKLNLYGLIERYSKAEERNQQIREAIISSEWLLLAAPSKGPYFITSDNPGFSISPEDEQIYNSKFTNGFAFHFPLSPMFCLLITDMNKDTDSFINQKNKCITKININDKGIIEVNNGSIQCINKILIASDEWYLSQIASINRPDKRLT